MVVVRRVSRVPGHNHILTFLDAVDAAIVRFYVP